MTLREHIAARIIERQNANKITALKIRSKAQDIAQGYSAVYWLDGRANNTRDHLLHGPISRAIVQLLKALDLADLLAVALDQKADEALGEIKREET